MYWSCDETLMMDNNLIYEGMTYISMYLKFSTATDNYNYPPCRIHDLVVLQVNYLNATITLQWTAPGSDMDNGAGK